MKDDLKAIGICSLVVLVALYAVGAVAHESLRHEVQTLPLWAPIVLGLMRRESARWCALPCLLFWLLVMSFIWLYLLGVSRIVSGHFSPAEIALTLVVGAASAAGIGFCFRHARWPWRARMVIVLFGLVQFAAFRVSLLPAIAHR